MDAPSVDLRDHVRVDPLPAGSGEAEVLERIEQLRSRRLDPSRPLWEVWFLPGLSDGRVAMYVRLHHLPRGRHGGDEDRIDFLDAEPDPPATSAPSWMPAAPPSGRELRADYLRGRRRKVRQDGRFVPSIRCARSVAPGTRGRRSARALRGGAGASNEPGPDRRARPQARRDPTGSTRSSGLPTRTAERNDVLLAATEGGLRELLAAAANPRRSHPPFGSTSRPDAPRRRRAAGQSYRPDGAADAARRRRPRRATRWDANR